MARALCLAAAIYLAGALALAGVARADPGTPLETIGGSVDGGPVCKLALLAPFQGEQKELGDVILNGVKLAIKDFNSKERAVEVTVYDSNCNAQDSVAAFEAAAASKVVGVIGDVCSSASLASSVLANKDQIPMISASSTSPRLTTEGGKFFSRVAPSDVYQGEAGAMLIAAMGFKTVATIYSLDAYGESIKHEIFVTFSKMEQAAKAGLAVVYEIGFKGDWVEGSLGGLLAAKPDAVVLTVGSAGADGSIVAIAQELRALGWEGQIFGTDTIALDSLLKGEGGEALEGAYALGLYVGSDEFIEKYKAAYDVTNMPQKAAQAYDTTKIFLKNCLSDKGTPLSGAAIQAKLVKPYGNNQVMLNGALGRVVFDKNGDITVPQYSSFKATGGSWVLEDSTVIGK